MLSGLAAHVLFGLPRRGLALTLAGQQSIFNFTASLDTGTGSLPRDPRTVVARYSLDPVTRILVCCPDCFRLFDFKPGMAEPRRFSGPLLPGGPPCGAALYKTMRIKDREYDVPYRKQYFQDLRHWLARLLSRPGIEDMLENPSQRRIYDDDPMFDFWDSLSAIRHRDHDGKPYLPPVASSDPSHTLRLLFSFSLDGFNPFHMKQAKQTATSTGVWLFLLNLPLHLRYREENSFKFTLLPGHRAPSMEQINHTLDELANTLQPLFHPGFSFSRTHKHLHGRTVRGQIVPIVADSPAVRQCCGFAPVTSEYFCTACKLPLQDIENIDKSTWPPRDSRAHRQAAIQWLQAEDQETRDRLYDENGVRWTPFYRVPGFDPIKQADSEAWHVMFEGILQHLIRVVWGVSWEREDGDGDSIDPNKIPSRPSDAVLEQWLHTIRSEAEKDAWDLLSKKLRGKTCPANLSWHLCSTLGLRTAGSKAQRAAHIIRWVSRVYSP